MDINHLKEVTGIKTPSPYQLTLFEEIQQQVVNLEAGQQTTSIFISALAGVGKTTSIIGCANLIPDKFNTLFLCFNKEIQQELVKRLNVGKKAMTLNAHGYSVWNSYFRGVNNGAYPLLDDRKLYKIGKAAYGERIIPYWKTVKELVSLCKNYGAVPPTIANVTPVDNQYAGPEFYMGLMKRYNIFINPPDRTTVFNMATKVLEKSILQEHTIDFDDQKYLPVIKRVANTNIPFIKYNVIFVDELQDVNKVDIEIIKNSLAPNGIVVGVGDENQAIYGFRGSDIEAIARFKSLFGVKQLPLPICYRCPKEIINHAQELVPEIQAASFAIDGEVQTLDRFNLTDLDVGDMVLCRNNAPLIEMAYRLIGVGKPVQFKGKDLGSGLKTIITTSLKFSKLANKRSTTEDIGNVSITDAMAALGKWVGKEIENFRKVIDVDYIEQEKQLMDRFKVVETICRHSNGFTVQAILDDIDFFFGNTKDNDEEKVILSTVHKSKGLENDKIFILDRHLFYQFGKRAPLEWQLKQEQNLDYVARTRAKYGLYYITTEGLTD